MSTNDISHNKIRHTFVYAYPRTYIFAISVFIAYDRLVERRKNLVLTKALQSTAIVTSLFPQNIAERLMDQQQTAADDKNHNVKRPAISFLAEARNYYLYEISNYSDNIYHDYDMMMVVDMDMIYGWDMRGLYHSFSHVNDWEMICSNGVGHKSGSMYDRFAFQLLNIGNKTRWHTRFYEPDSGLVPVKSCFGGLAFYKLSSINGCYYDSTSEGCEHISFHKCIKSQHDGRLYLNPTQIIRYSHYS